MITKISRPIHQVIIYKGHEKNPLLGPYFTSIANRISMFNKMNTYRKDMGKPTWNVTAVAGEHLVDALKNSNPQETLLVIPAGESSNLDKVFSIAETSFIKEAFFMVGGRGELNCGAAYWGSRRRIYNDLSADSTDVRKTTIKISHLSLFEGTAEGPLSSFSGRKYQVGLDSDAVCLTDGKDTCTFYLSGGGSFFPDEGIQKVKVLAKYLPRDLMRYGKPLQECKKWENAGIMVSVGEGAVLLSSIHPYYGPEDIDVEAYEKAFPECGTNWRETKKRLSPQDARMRFVLNSMLSPLENLDWSN